MPGKNFHHLRSEINSLFSLMWWCGCWIVWTSEINWRRNTFPAGFTLDAWYIVPRNGSNSCLVQDGQCLTCSWLQSQWLHSLVRHYNHSSVSAGRGSSCWDVSIIIPRNSIVVLGPACFSGAKGMPRSLQVALKSPKLWWHCSDPGGPRMAKLSRKWHTNSTPSAAMHHSRSLAKALKILGADLRPNGSLTST